MMPRVAAETAPGLWPDHGEVQRSSWLELLVVYALVPAGLTALDPTSSLREWLSSWFRFALVGGCIGGSLQVLYARFWPAVLRRELGWPAATLAHAASCAGAVLVGGEVATRLVSWIYGYAPGVVRPGVWRLGLMVTVSIVGVMLGYARLRAHARRAEAGALAQRAAADRARLDALVAR